MNVRITPRENRQRTDLYSGIWAVRSMGALLYLYHHDSLDVDVLPMSTVAEIQLDDEPGDWWG